MNNLLKICTLTMIITCPVLLIGQTKCKVLLNSISDTYEGKCKKGFANGKGVAIGIDKYEGRFSKGYPNGKGIYTWASGAEYIGQWEFGKREGKGAYKFIYNGRDSIMAGIWKDDVYMGPVPPPPTVIRARNLQKYQFMKVGKKNKLTIEIYMNGTINTTIENLSIVSSNGSFQNFGNAIVFNDMIYPASFKVTYLSWNKFHTERLNVVMEFEISEPGDWLLKITN